MDNHHNETTSHDTKWRKLLLQYRQYRNQEQSEVSSQKSSQSKYYDQEKSADSVLRLLNSVPLSLPAPNDSSPSLRYPTVMDSVYELLEEDVFKYPEAQCFHGAPRIDESLDQYEDYLQHNVRRLIHKPWKVNIANLKVCMTNDILNSISHDDFENAQTVASKMVDKVLADAVFAVNKQLVAENESTEELYEEPKLLTVKKNEDDFYWPQMNHFDPERIKDFIRLYVSQWSLDSGFKYFIRYISFDKTDTSEFHYYQVMFSKVTISCPNPQATASAFFTVEVTPVVVETMPVRVTYQFEHYSQVHVPDGRTKFQKFIINNIIKRKLQIFTELDF